jgi:hypothetical protein
MPSFTFVPTATALNHISEIPGNPIANPVIPPDPIFATPPAAPVIEQLFGIHDTIDVLGQTPPPTDFHFG